METNPLPLDELYEKARQVQANAYAPYSQDKVGAAVMTKDGSIFTGATVETANWVFLCAEHVAIANAVSAGKPDILALARYPSAFPCGVCRQAMVEFNHNLIFIFERDGKLQTTTMDALLPSSFGPWSIPCAT
jgi:cytidine deaminase